jgi:DinB superfamily
MTMQATGTVAESPKKAEIIEAIERTWSALEESITGADEETLSTIGRDGWSVKDHLAHIEVWERYLLALLERRSPSAAIGIDLETMRTADDDNLNALLVAPTRTQSIDRVLTDLRDTHGCLMAVIAALPEGDLEQLPSHYQPDELGEDTDTIAGWITHICDEHLRDHVEWIRDLRKRR